VLIDWFTVGAQIVNFLILVVLLKKFLYGPITQTMAAREAKIKDQLAVAASRQQAATAEEAAVHQRLQELEDKRQALAAQVKAEVEDQKKALLEEARKEVEQNRQGWLETLEREKTALAQSLKERLGYQVFALARLILRELGDTSLEKHFIEVFLKKLQELKPKDQQVFRESLAESAGKAVVASVFDLEEEDRARIGAAVQAQFGSEVTLRFETDPGLIMGIEVRTLARKLSWATEGCLQNLEERLGETFTGFPKEKLHDK
jgi:F-type H+-transporting ATPase subunit b